MRKKIVVLFVLMMSLLFAGCNASVEFVVTSTSEDTTYTIYIIASPEHLDEMYGTKRAALENWIESNALVNGYNYSVESYGYMLTKTEPRADEDDDEEVKPTSTNFFFENYKFSSTTSFYGLLDLVESYDGTGAATDNLASKMLYGYEVPEFSNGVLGVYRQKGFWDVVDGDQNIIEQVKSSITTLGLSYEMKNSYVGFYSDADYISRSFGVASHRWDLTGDSNRSITIGQNIPVVANWYIVLLIFTGFFVVVSVGIYLLLQIRKPKKPYDQSIN